MYLSKYRIVPLIGFFFLKVARFSKYQNSVLNGLTVPTFDFVTVQFYETYSHADFNITVLGDSPAVYLTNIVERLTNGWEVLFDMDPAIDYPSQVGLGGVFQI
jgi:hypothetical protein